MTALGIIAGRTIVPNQTLAAGSYNFSHPIQIFCGAGLSLSAIIVEFANWYGSNEAGTGGTLYANAQLEYPIGTFSRITFGAANLGSVADGGTLISDLSPLSVPVPDGAAAVFHGRVENSVAVPFCGSMFSDLAGGDALTLDPSDLTGTHITDTLAGGMFPLALRGLTSRETFAFVGDSIGAAASDNSGSAPHRGFLPRAVASISRAYVNMCVPGDTASNFLIYGAKRRAVITRCAPTTIICEYGTNDLNVQHHSAATLETDLNSLRALFSATPLYQTTILPETASTDGWTTTGNQSLGSSEAQRLIIDGRIRGGSLTATGFLETNTAFETAFNSGIINAPGYTADGGHPSTVGHTAIAAALAPQLTSIISGAVSPPPAPGIKNYQMQARSSANGRLYTWLSVGGTDRAGTGFPGPGTPLDIAQYI